MLFSLRSFCLRAPSATAPWGLGSLRKIRMPFRRLRAVENPCPKTTWKFSSPKRSLSRRRGRWLPTARARCLPGSGSRRAPTPPLALSFKEGWRGYSLGVASFQFIRLKPCSVNPGICWWQQDSYLGEGFGNELELQMKAGSPGV